MKVIVPKRKIEPSSGMPEFIKSPVKLTISLLVSNRVETIRKCMESLKPILEAVPSELIAVDTVGEEHSDGSLDIVREYTDKIVHFNWTGDFAQARNAGMDLAKGEWFMFVDDDEWFDDPSEIVEFFRTGDYLQYGMARYTVHNYIEESLTRYSTGWVSRLVRRTPETKFIHPVHEMFFPAYNPEKRFTKTFAHHVGYVFKSQDEKDKHFERNLPPLLEELEKYPNDLRILMQIVQEYQFKQQYDKAEEYCRRGEQMDNCNYPATWNWVMAALVTIQTAQNKWEETLAEGRRVLQLPHLNELARMNIVYLMCFAAENLEDFEAELEYAKEYVRLLQYFDDHQEKFLEQVMLSMGDIMLEDRKENIHKSFFSTCKQLKRYDELCDISGSLPWEKEYMHKRLYLLLLTEAAAKTKRYDCFTQVAQRLCGLELEPSEFMPTIQEICQQVCIEQFDLRQAVAKVDTDKPYFLVMKAWCAEKDGEDIQPSLQKCLEHGLDCAVPREELLGICLRTGKDPTPFLEPLYMEDWAVSFSQLVKNTPKDDLQELLDGAQKILCSVNESQYFALSKMICERELADQDFPSEKLWETSRDYARDILGYYRSLYRTELFENNVKQSLPREAMFALQLQKALQAREQRDLETTFSALKECVKAYPPQKEFVNRLICQIESEMDKQKEAQQEFAALGEQIKKQLYQLITLGEMTQAQKILETLRTLTPNDQELDVIAEKIS